MNGVDMKGFVQSWYEICNADGHALVLDVTNKFESEDLAASKAASVCKDYRDTVTVKLHSTTIIRIFHADITVTEV